MKAQVSIKITGPIKIGGPGEKETFVRPEDALDFLFLALTAKSEEERTAGIQGALSAYYCGLLNKHRFKVNESRRGRPLGSTGRRIDDSQVLQLMKRVASDTGETSARKLAQLAIEMGEVDLRNAEKDSVVRRLTSAYQDLQK